MRKISIMFMENFKELKVGGWGQLFLTEGGETVVLDRGEGSCS